MRLLTRQSLCWLVCTVALALALAASRAAAQTTPASRGLDELSDDRLLGELAQRGLATLIDRAFQTTQVPPAKQQGVRALLGLRRLADPQAGLASAQRRAIVAEVVANMDGALPAMDDPRLLMQQASMLIRLAMERDINTLEYWGESEATQQALRPVAEVVVKLLAKASELATQQAETLANQARGLGDPRVAQSEAMVNLATQATYTQHMAEYYRALSMPAGDAERKRIAEAAIAGLAAFDTPDSQVQPAVRNRIGKLHLAAGDAASAKSVLATVAGTSGEALQPPPTIAQQYEARYFSALAELVAEDPDAAERALAQLVQWQNANLPADERTRAGADAAAAMLEHRIHLARAEMASDPAARQEASAKATETLMALVNRRPELQAVVFEQIAQTLPRNPDLRQLDPLMLQTLVRRADDERLKPADQAADEATMERGLAAARELLRRRDAAGIDRQTIASAALLMPLLLQRLDRPAEAADAFLDYVRDFDADPQRRAVAMEAALSLVAELRRDAPDDPTTQRLYERILPVAIDPPYNRTEFAFEWARRLQVLGRYKEAAAYYQRVPDNDPRKATARFYEVVVLQQRLDHESMNDQDRQQVIAAIIEGARDVRRRAEQVMSQSPSDEQRLTARSLVARTALLAADVARREQDDPATALRLLEGFEGEAAGVPAEQDLLNGALFTRVQAYMQLGRNDEATQTLLELLRTRGGDEGASIVHNLLEKLNADLDRARSAGDTQRVLELARHRASLSGTLVEWAQGNTDPNIQRYAYRYRVFDASAKHLAADLEPDAARRREALEQALALHESLMSPQSMEMYRATRPPGETGANDPQVLLGVGLIQFALGNYEQAQKSLGPLLTERRLGSATLVVTEHDQSRIAPNEQYWEATYKLLASNVALAEQDAARSALRDESARFIKQLYIQWGRELAGTKWREQFDELRQKIAGDFVPPDITAATQPMARP